MIEKLISDKKRLLLSKTKVYKKKDKKNLSRKELDDLIILVAEYLNLV